MLHPSLLLGVVNIQRHALNKKQKIKRRTPVFNFIMIFYSTVFIGDAGGQNFEDLE